MTTNVRLIGGRFDGLTGEVGPAAIQHGCVVVAECPRHGIEPGEECECGDATWYGYFADRKLSELRFVVVDGDD